MKKSIILLLLLALSVASAMAQIRYVSSTRMGQEDRRADLNGKGGVLILSKRSDLVVSVINAKHASIAPPEKGKNGYYEYRVAVDMKETTAPQVEVSKRGDVYREKFVADVSPDYLSAYLIDEVEKPIAKEDMTASNDAILDASLAEVEITTAIDGLRVDCNPALGATVSTSARRSDTSIKIISVKIPVANITAAKEKIEALRKEYKALDDRIKSQNGKKPDADFDRRDQLEEDISAAEADFANMCSIDIYAQETNHISIEVGDMGPRSKRCYGILAVKTVVREHVSKCGGLMEEGGRLFANRKYDEAKRAFFNALKAEDTPGDFIPVINSNIAQCDTCILYETLAKQALVEIKKRKDSGTVTQEDVALYYNAAIEFISVAERYNPCDYYTQILNQMNTYVEHMPIAMRFTIVKWKVDRVSAYEGGAYSGVEVWAYYGADEPRRTDFSTDKKFMKLISGAAGQYRRVGVSGVDGVVDMELSRKEMPKGFFFRPLNSMWGTTIDYKDMYEVLSRCKTEYNKKQYRMKLYVRQ